MRKNLVAIIALAAAREPIGVTIGASLGHMLCTGLAVVGGKLLAARISERTVLLSGGGLFCLFALRAHVGVTGSARRPGRSRDDLGTITSRTPVSWGPASLRGTP